MTINTKTLRTAAFRVIDEGGLAWFDAEQLGCKNGLDIPETDAQFIAAASPKNIIDLIDAQAARIEAQDIIVRSVAAALERHGVTEADDPGEAIDVLVADKDAEIKRLREALQVACDHIDMGRLEISHCKDAALIRAALQGESK